MRANIILGVAVASIFLLQGCGRKGPLKLPAPQAQTSQVQTPQSQMPQVQTPGTPAPDAQKSDTLIPQQSPASK